MDVLIFLIFEITSTIWKIKIVQFFARINVVKAVVFASLSVVNYWS